MRKSHGAPATSAHGRAAAAGLDSRRAALEILLRVEGGRAFADVLLGHRLVAFPPRERRLVTSLVLGVLAWRDRLDHEIRYLARREPPALEPRTLMILRLGIFQLRFLTRIAHHGVVDTAVRLAKETPTTLGAAGLINAVLRRATLEETALPDRARDEAGYLAVVWSHPRWMVERFIEWFGTAGAEALLEANNRPAPNAIRLNLARGTPEALLERIRAEGFQPASGARLPETVVLEGAIDFSSRAWSDGLFHAQSEASQLVSRLLAPPPGASVLDCAAAPGGKTTHLAELAGERATIVAADRSFGGLMKARAVAERLGHHGIAMVVADMAVAAPFRARTFDALLLDAPCTGLGTLREHPELRWRLRPDDIARMAALQARMLSQVADLVRPGGALVYAVCSLAPEEGLGVIRDFLERRPEFTVDHNPPFAAEVRIPLDANGYLVTRPDRDGLDGFFAVRLLRR